MSESFEDDDVLRARLEECLLANNAKEMKILKLRAALEEIVNVGDGWGGPGTTGDGHARCREIARKALADREQE